VWVFSAFLSVGELDDGLLAGILYFRAEIFDELLIFTWLLVLLDNIVLVQFESLDLLQIYLICALWELVFQDVKVGFWQD
jgi:hypothetical protein